MSVVSYSELLRFTLPEIAVMVAGLLALTLDLTVLRRSATKMRFGVAALIGCVGCLIAMYGLTQAAAQYSLPDGMFVMTR